MKNMDSNIINDIDYNMNEFSHLSEIKVYLDKSDAIDLYVIIRTLLNHVNHQDYHYIHGKMISILNRVEEGINQEINLDNVVNI